MTRRSRAESSGGTSSTSALLIFNLPKFCRPSNYVLSHARTHVERRQVDVVAVLSETCRDRYLGIPRKVEKTFPGWVYRSFAATPRATFRFSSAQSAAHDICFGNVMQRLCMGLAILEKASGPTTATNCVSNRE